MNTQDQTSHDQTNIIERIQKLMTLSNHHATPEHEASTAAALAQKLLTAYNLDIATVEKAAASGSGAAREDAKTSGGMYKYERELWRRVAELNFCMYWTLQRDTSAGWDHVTGERVRAKRTFRHQVVGRVVNVRSTQAMAGYLVQAIDRLCRDWMAERGMGNAQFFRREAVAYREGMADRLSDRLHARRREQERERQAEAARQAAANPGSSTALTIADVHKSEYDANNDFLYGEGTTARWAAQSAEAEENQRKVHEELAAWEAAHPEEAAKAKRKREAEDRAREAKWRKQRERSHYRAPTDEELRRQTSEFQAGRRAGDEVGLDPQVDVSKQRRLS